MGRNKRAPDAPDKLAKAKAKKLKPADAKTVERNTKGSRRIHIEK